MKVISKFSTLFLFVILSVFAAQAYAQDTSPSSSQAMLNINSADAQQISDALKGIGLKKAQAIVEYRENYGNFEHIDELTAVKGIGKNTLDKNVHLISLE